MTSIGWLHLADLHQTVRSPGWTAPGIRERVLEDLTILHDRAGPWDLVIVAGDLSMRGAPEELEDAEKAFDALSNHIQRLGGVEPCLLAVPGNHDLARPRDPSPSALRALRRWHDDPQVRHEFWNDPESPARRLIDRAFEPFERWWNARRFPDHVRVRRGLLPGDFTATVDKDGIRFGVAGLNSAFLQVTGDDYEGRLAIDPLQLTIAAGGDVPAWIARHDAAVLVTHHAPSWLAPEERQRYEAGIHPAGRFAAHLAAHLHEAAPLVEQGERPQIRCPSFFGIDAYEDRRGKPGARRLGYSAGRLALDGGRLEVFPRSYGNDRLQPAFALADLDPDGKVTLPAARFPRLADEAPRFSLERAALRDALAAVYRSPADARRLAREAGVRVDESAGGGAAADLWHVVASEAARRGRLGDLVRIARIEYPSEPGIAAAWTAFERSSQRDPGVRTRGSGSRDERVADALFERLAELQAPAFEAAIALVDLDQQLVDSNAPQPSRAMAAVRQVEKEGAPALERLATAVTRVSGSTPPSDGALRGGATRSAGPRTPTRPSLSKLLTVMFTDERDFDGFCLDHFPAVYRRFTNGMNRAFRVRLLIDHAEPAEIVARLKRAHPSAFTTHQRVLDYEDDDTPAAPGRSRSR
jgi:hypothetical protein